MISIIVGFAGATLLSLSLLIAAIWGNGVAKTGGDWREAIAAAGVSGLAVGLLVLAGRMWGGV